jgi:hypothetical protein
VNPVIQSFEEFKTAVITSLQNKVAERIAQEREYISNSLLHGEIADSGAPETQSNAAEN